MDSKRSRSGAATPQRRRGQALEDALLDAAWDELLHVGYAALTMEAVAARAQTSRPVLHRRWPNRSELVIAAARRRDKQSAIVPPDTGTFRDDVIALMKESNHHRSELAAVMSLQLAGFYEETGVTPAILRERLLEGRAKVFDMIVTRAADRGEIDPARLTTRMIRLPFDLFRHELMMNLGSVPDDVILEIVDDIYLPLVMQQPSPA